MPKLFLLFSVFSFLFTSSVFSDNSLISHEDFPEMILNPCFADSCDDEAIDSLEGYKNAGQIVLPEKHSIYIGNCSFSGQGVFYDGAFSLMVIRKYYNKYYGSLRLSSPRHDYNGEPYVNRWLEEPKEKIFMYMDNIVLKDFSGLNEIKEKNGFSYINSMRKDNDETFVFWMRGADNGKKLYAMGFWVDLSAYYCQFDLFETF